MDFITDFIPQILYMTALLAGGFVTIILLCIIAYYTGVHVAGPLVAATTRPWLLKLIEKDLAQQKAAGGERSQTLPKPEEQFKIVSKVLGCFVLFLFLTFAIIGEGSMEQARHIDNPKRRFTAAEIGGVLARSYVESILAIVVLRALFAAMRKDCRW